MAHSLQRSLGMQYLECDEQALGSEYQLSLDESGLVLLAEDDESYRDALSTVLAADGYDVVGVRTGVAALSYLDAAFAQPYELEPPDLIVVDCRRPVIDGLDVILHVARVFAVPVIVLTGIGFDDVHRHARELGAAQVFDKPLDLDLFRCTVAELIASPPPPAAVDRQRYVC